MIVFLKCEKFWSSFFKSLWVGRAKPSSRSAEREISSALFFLLTFSFAPIWSKEKVAKEFRLFKGGRTQFAPTVEQGEHIDCERKFVRFRVVEDVDPYNQYAYGVKRKVAKDFTYFKDQDVLF